MLGNGCCCSFSFNNIISFCFGSGWCDAFRFTANHRAGSFHFGGVARLEKAVKIQGALLLLFSQQSLHALLASVRHFMSHGCSHWYVALLYFIPTLSRVADGSKSNASLALGFTTAENGSSHLTLPRRSALGPAGLLACRGRARELPRLPGQAPACWRLLRRQASASNRL